MKNLLKTKKGQEEMVGFALIIVIVAVILLIFLGFTLRKSEINTIKSYEIDSFLSGLTEYTTDCRDKNYGNYLNVKKLLFECEEDNLCLDNTKACIVMDEVLKGLVEASWKPSQDNLIKGYALNITSNGDQFYFYEQGNRTRNSKGSVTSSGKLGTTIDVFFTTYY